MASANDTYPAVQLSMEISGEEDVESEQVPRDPSAIRRSPRKHAPPTGGSNVAPKEKKQDSVQSAMHTQEVGTIPEIEEVLEPGRFKNIMLATAKQTSNHIVTLLLPVLTVVSGLMGASSCRTHRNINFEEPNVLWTCVASPPGSKKSVALKCILNALRTVQQRTGDRGSEGNLDDSLAAIQPGSLFSCNETISTAKLADQLTANDGVYLNIFDKIDGLFESLDGKAREQLDRSLWLSLYTGRPVTRSATKKTTTVDATRMNYTGFIRPSLLQKRLAKVGDDRFMNRHLVTVTSRKEVYFKDIGAKVEAGADLALVFKEVFSHHHDEQLKNETVSYMLTEESDLVFATFFDNMEDEYESLALHGKERLLGMIGKASGHVLRLAMVFQAIHNAVDNPIPKSNNYAVEEQSVREAIGLMKLLIQEKKALMN